MSPDVLARKLRRLSGVHLYEDIDYDIVASSVDPALDDFGAFVRHLHERLPEME